MNRLLSILILAVMVSSVFSISAAYAAAPNSPVNLGMDGQPATTSIPLAWDAPIGGDAPTGYTIEGALEIPGNPPTFGSYNTLVADTGDVTSYTVTGLNAGDYYEFRVTAFNGDGSSSPSLVFTAGTAFAAGHDFSDEQQDFGKGTYSGPLPLDERLAGAKTTEWYLIFDDLGVDAVAGLDGDVYPNNITIYADFSATSTGFIDNDIIFTDSLSSGTVGVIDCVDNATCELADLTAAISYPNLTTVNFDYEQETEFTEGAEFAEGQQFVQGQTFDAAMDFSGGAMNFDDGTQFNEIQNFGEAGAFSSMLTLPERTTPTTEWADVFDDLGIDTVTGYDQDTGLNIESYETGIIYQDFTAVTAGSNWHDISFVDSNANGKIDCADAGSCELADMTQGVTYAAGTGTTFDYVIEMEFTGDDIYFEAGQDFGKGQDFDGAMDFSGGQMIFDDGTSFNEIQDFGEAGVFSPTLSNLPLRTTPTTEWADIFDDLGISSVTGQDNSGAGADYPTGVTIYADFSATTAGSDWNDILFTDLNSNGKIDCSDSSNCELADMTQAVTYADA
ncbi:MAG: fibronectin type III domain-containing protein, partial [Gammaproteobacteria bacterium]|nr:fibronectin type III domain-containing protein [Gammaproteobacteria bacterium]